MRSGCPAANTIRSLLGGSWLCPVPLLVSLCPCPHPCHLLPGGRCHHAAALLRGGLHAAALVVVAHAKVVADLVGHGGGGSDGVLRVVLQGERGLGQFWGGPQGPQEGPAAALGPQLGATRGGPVEEVGFGLLEAQQGKDLGLEMTAEKMGTWRACPKRQKPRAPRCQPEPGTTGSPGPRGHWDHRHPIGRGMRGLRGGR